MKKSKILNGRRRRRQYRVRRDLKGSPDRPRLSIYRSHTNVSAQIIDDVAGKTLVAAGSNDVDLRAQIGYGGNIKAAAAIGKIVAERAIAQGIKAVCFDRGHNRYHGRVAALADAAREVGLSF